METYVSQRDGTSGVEIAVYGEGHGDGSRENGGVGADLMSSNTVSPIRQRVRQACRMKLTEELRKLCKQHAPSALQHETIVRQLRRGEPVQAPVLRDSREHDSGEEGESESRSGTGFETSRAGITEELQQEWDDAQKELEKWTEYYWTFTSMDTQKRLLEKDLNDGLDPDYTSIRMLGIARNFFIKCQNADTRYRAVQRKSNVGWA